MLDWCRMRRDERQCPVWLDLEVLRSLDHGHQTRQGRRCRNARRRCRSRQPGGQLIAQLSELLADTGGHRRRGRFGPVGRKTAVEIALLFEQQPARPRQRYRDDRRCRQRAGQEAEAVTAARRNLAIL